MLKKQITIPSGSEYSEWHDLNVYVDKTYIISQISGALKKKSAIFFARPRRWGKSLFLSTMKYYFGKEFYKEEYFKDKLIWEDEELKKKAGNYQIINLDLKPLYDHEKKKINYDNLYSQIANQIGYEYLKDKIIDLYGEKYEIKKLGKENILEIIKNKYKTGELIKEFVTNVSETENILLLIDEYDKPINDCLKYQKNEAIAKKLLEDMKNQFFSHLKDIPCVTLVTGVNKLSMASFFSDFNNLMDYSFLVNLGYTEEETNNLFDKLGIQKNELIKKWYNGYNYECGDEYNPWAINTYFIKQLLEPYWSRTGTSPEYFRYLVQDILKINKLEEYLEKINSIEFTNKIINLDYISEMNPEVVLHYFYYAGLLTFTIENTFAIPNNDVLKSYEDLIFKSTETKHYLNLRNKATDAFLYLNQETESLKQFILYLLNEKYVYHDKKSLAEIGEQVITSDIALLMKTFIRVDIRREVSILEGRTDLEYIDMHGDRILFEFKVINSRNYKSRKNKGLKQLEKYGNTGRYQKMYLILIDTKKITVEIINN